MSDHDNTDKRVRHFHKQEVQEESKDDIVKDVRNVHALISRFQTTLNNDSRSEYQNQINRTMHKITTADYGVPKTTQEAEARSLALSQLTTTIGTQGMSHTEKSFITETIICSSLMLKSSEVSQATGMKVSMLTSSASKASYPRRYEQSFEYKQMKTNEISKYIQDVDLTTCSHSSILSVFDGVLAHASQAFEEYSFCLFLNVDPSFFQGSFGRKDKFKNFMVGPVIFFLDQAYSSDEFSPNNFSNESSKFMSAHLIHQCALFYCEECRHFGLYNGLTKQKLSHVNVQLGLDRILQAIAKAESETILYQLLSAYLCYLAALRSFLPHNMVPTKPHSYQTFILEAIVSLKESTLISKFTNSEKLGHIAAMMELMSAMVFMKTEITVMTRWTSLMYFLDLIKKWVCFDNMDAFSAYNLLPDNFSTIHFDFDKIHQDTLPQVIFKLVGTSTINVHIGHFSWYTDDSLLDEIPLAKAFISPFAICSKFTLKSFRSDCSVERALSNIVFAFMCFFLLFMWTQGVYRIGIENMIEMLKDAVATINENDVNGNYCQYAFEYPTPATMEEFIDELKGILFNNYIDKCLFGWEYFAAFISSCFCIRTTYYSKVALRGGEVSKIKTETNDTDLDMSDIDALLAGVDNFSGGEVEDQDIARFNDMIANAENSLADEEKSMQRIEDEYNRQKKKIDDTRAKREEEYKITMKELHEELLNIHAKIYELGQEINKLQITIKVQEKSVVQLASEISNKTAAYLKVADNLKKLSSARKILEDKQKQYEQIKAEVTRLAEESDKNKLKISDLSNTYEEMQKEAVELKKTMANYEESSFCFKLKMKHMELQEAQLLVTQNQIKYQEMVLKSKSTDVLIEKQKEERKKLDKEIADGTETAKKQRDEIVNTLKTKTAEIASMVKTKQAFTDAVDKQKQAIKQFTEKVNKAEEANSNLKDECKLAREATKKSMAEVIATKSCVCSTQLHFNTQMMTNIFLNTESKTYRLHLTVKDPASKEIKGACFTLALAKGCTAQSAILHSVCNIFISNVEISNDDLIRLLTHFVKTLAGGLNLNQFERYHLSQLICCFAYCCAQKGLAIDSLKVAGSTDLAYVLVEKASKMYKVDDRSNHTALSDALDHANDNASYPHLHCNLKDCTTEALTVPDISREHIKSSELVTKVSSSFSYKFYMAHDGKLFATQANAEDLVSFSELVSSLNLCAQEVLNSDLSSTEAYLALLLMYLILCDWLHEDDKRKENAHSYLHNVFSSFTKGKAEEWLSLLGKCSSSSVPHGTHYHKSSYKMFQIRCVHAMIISESSAVSDRSLVKDRSLPSMDLPYLQMSSNMPGLYTVTLKTDKAVYLTHKSSDHTKTAEVKDLTEKLEKIFNLLENVDLLTSLELEGILMMLVVVAWKLSHAGNKDMSAIQSCLLNAIAISKLSKASKKASVRIALLVAAFASISSFHSKTALHQAITMYSSFVMKSLKASESANKLLKEFYGTDDQTIVSAKKMIISVPTEKSGPIRSLSIIQGQEEPIVYQLYHQQHVGDRFMMKLNGTELKNDEIKDLACLEALDTLHKLFSSKFTRELLRQLLMLIMLLICLEDKLGSHAESKSPKKGILNVLIGEVTSDLIYENSPKLQMIARLLQCGARCVDSITGEKKLKHHDDESDSYMLLFEYLSSSVLELNEIEDKAFDNRAKNVTVFNYFGKSVYVLYADNKMAKFCLSKKGENGIFSLRDTKTYRGKPIWQAQRYEPLRAFLEASISITSMNANLVLDVARVGLIAILFLRSCADVPTEHAQMIEKYILSPFSAGMFTVAGSVNQLQITRTNKFLHDVTEMPASTFKGDVCKLFTTKCFELLNILSGEIETSEESFTTTWEYSE